MKFVVIGAPRTGTTMFLITLNTLKEFDTYGEVLAMNRKNPVPHPQIHIENFRKRTFKAGIGKSDSNMIGFLNQLFSSGINVGFKFLYQHATNMPQVVNYIKNPKNDVYKVHLKRKNPVKRVVSGLLNRHHHYGEGTSIVKPNVVLNGVKRGEKWDDQLFKMFGGEKYMDMYFEDFTKDTNTSKLDFTEVFDFFGLNINPMVKVPTKKYGPDKLKDRVGNYGALHKYFKQNAPEYLKYVEE